MQVTICNNKLRALAMIKIYSHWINDSSLATTRKDLAYQLVVTFLPILIPQRKYVQNPSKYSIYSLNQFYGVSQKGQLQFTDESSINKRSLSVKIMFSSSWL